MTYRLPDFRPAQPEDSAFIQSIYAHHVLHGTGTFEETPPTVEQMERLVHTIKSEAWPFIVAEDRTGIIGYAYAAQFRDRSAYRYCAEDSVYVREDVRGQGVGKALLTLLLHESARAGFRQMVALIGDAENIGSIGVHATLGFKSVGRLREVGVKLGRTLDVVLMQRALTALDTGSERESIQSL
ncbi:Phosphinothricin N-acetyltransferase [Granulibacter bethesdensis]|uniref:Phosphinothricin N-acetyltransferase n=1 Tax=Granulibacter bethesdensis TaxID=364410 RepID=A0AAN0VEX4_9PROT|nr:GNAT family N-acetyltransferase [Granulibacter bethesdensis]AHJ61941.1 Phosphinothricin N-acetyltransferase [Granulibacter bethesdensis]